MAVPVDEAYDAVAQLYSELFINDLDRVASDRELLDAFATRVDINNSPGVVLDVGCGPGHIVDYLSRRGVEIAGVDISPQMIAQASRLFPEESFAVGDIGALPYAHGSLGGIVARYSLIHMEPSVFAEVFAHWADLLAPGAPVAVSFFAADDPGSHGNPFDHKVATAHQLSPDVLLKELEQVGIENLNVTLRGPLEGERPIGHGSITGSQRPIS